MAKGKFITCIAPNCSLIFSALIYPNSLKFYCSGFTYAIILEVYQIKPYTAKERVCLPCFVGFSSFEVRQNAYGCLFLLHLRETHLLLPKHPHSLKPYTSKFNRNLSLHIACSTKLFYTAVCKVDSCNPLNASLQANITLFFN